MAQVVDFPFVPDNKKPPAEIPIRFRYDLTMQRELTVRADDGQPISDAIVDLEKVEDLAANRRIRLGTYKTSDAGQLRLAGGAEQLIEVFVYADGYEPRRAIWSPGMPLSLTLTPQDASLSFKTPPSAELARIRLAANPNIVRTINLRTAAQTLLAPGEYEVTTYDDRGMVLGYQRINLRTAESKVVDLSADQRPRLTVRFPSTGWKSGIEESTPRGGSVNWMAMIAVAGALEFEDVPATTVQSSTDREDVYLLSRAGRMQVQVQNGDSPILWREINVAPDESLVIDVPAERATLEAPSNFDPGRGHVHGIAGPRMQLIANDPSRWSITEFLPKQSKSGIFTISGIPPGDYRLYHHLFNGRADAASAAWGGVDVHLTAGKTTRIASLKTKLGDLRVRLSDVSGSPINNATLRIRDRMSDSWRQIEENPAQLEQAGLPIPYPPAVRIVDGRATLSQIRSGWLEFLVERDTGSAYAYTMPVTLGQDLNVTVPADK
jgi:hypothetical protein